MDNPIKSFGDAVTALQFLKDTSVQPLFILCDVNMHSMGGIEFRQAIYDDEALRLKCIPFLFLSTAADPDCKRTYKSGQFKTRVLMF